MKYFLIAIITIGLFSCKKDSSESNLEETVYVRFNGADMPVYMRGNVESKAILLIVHGGPGGNGYEYRAGSWSPPVEENMAVAYWDQRGQGMSHGKYTDNEVTVASMAADMNAVVLTLKAKYGQDVSVFALGHSWGGTLTAKYMINPDYQKNLAGWIESNGAHDIPKLNKDAALMYERVAGEQIALGNSISEWQAILDWAIQIDTSAITDAQSGEINSNGNKVEGYLENDEILQKSESEGTEPSFFTSVVNPLTSFAVGSQTSNLLNAEIEATALTSELFKVNLPTLILWGRYDFIVPPTLGQDCFDYISTPVNKKKLVFFEKSGHSPMNNEADKFSAEVISFVASNK